MESARFNLWRAIEQEEVEDALSWIRAFRVSALAYLEPGPLADEVARALSEIEKGLGGE